MKESFKILFHKNGDPLDSRCIERIIWAFPSSYRKTVKAIVEKSEGLDKKAFKLLVAKLMPSFRMTRNPKYVFHGVKIQGGTVLDPKHALDKCWKTIKNDLPTLKDYINKNAGGSRNRAIAVLPPVSKDHVIEELSRLFEKLQEVEVENSEVGEVGASKVLFATVPEIALPVDNDEWKYVFKNMEYRKILTMMANEINEWEARFQPREHLERVDPNPNATTLPAIYNVMAMSVRERDKSVEQRERVTC